MSIGMLYSAEELQRLRKLRSEMKTVEVTTVFPTSLNQWLSNKAVAGILLAFERHAEWLSHQVYHRPASGSVFLFNRKEQMKFRKDGHNWEKRPDGRTTREDHAKLKIDGRARIYGCYAHSTDHECFHRRCYWLLDNPDIVFVHYLDKDQASGQTSASKQKRSDLPTAAVASSTPALSATSLAKLNAAVSSTSAELPIGSEPPLITSLDPLSFFSEPESVMSLTGDLGPSLPFEPLVGHGGDTRSFSWLKQESGVWPPAGSQYEVAPTPDDSDISTPDTVGDGDFEMHDSSDFLDHVTAGFLPLPMTVRHAFRPSSALSPRSSAPTAAGDLFMPSGDTSPFQSTMYRPHTSSTSRSLEALCLPGTTPKTKPAPASSSTSNKSKKALKPSSSVTKTGGKAASKKASTSTSAKNLPKAGPSTTSKSSQSSSSHSTTSAAKRDIEASSTVSRRQGANTSKRRNRTTSVRGRTASSDAKQRRFKRSLSTPLSVEAQETAPSMKRSGQTGVTAHLDLHIQPSSTSVASPSSSASSTTSSSKATSKTSGTMRSSISTKTRIMTPNESSSCTSSASEVALLPTCATKAATDYTAFAQGLSPTTAFTVRPIKAIAPSRITHKGQQVIVISTWMNVGDYSVRVGKTPVPAVLLQPGVVTFEAPKLDPGVYSCVVLFKGCIVSEQTQLAYESREAQGSQSICNSCGSLFAMTGDKVNDGNKTPTPAQVLGGNSSTATSSAANQPIAGLCVKPALSIDATMDTQVAATLPTSQSRPEDFVVQSASGHGQVLATAATISSDTSSAARGDEAPPYPIESRPRSMSLPGQRIPPSAAAATSQASSKAAASLAESTHDMQTTSSFPNSPTFEPMPEQQRSISPPPDLLHVPSGRIHSFSESEQTSEASFCSSRPPLTRRASEPALGQTTVSSAGPPPLFDPRTQRCILEGEASPDKDMLHFDESVSSFRERTLVRAASSSDIGAGHAPMDTSTRSAPASPACERHLIISDGRGHAVRKSLFDITWQDFLSDVGRQRFAELSLKDQGSPEARASMSTSHASSTASSPPSGRFVEGHAARVIQKAFRQYMVLERQKRETAAALVIQKFFRRYKQQLVQKERAARVIQRHYLRYKQQKSQHSCNHSGRRTLTPREIEAASRIVRALKRWKRHRSAYEQITA